METLNSQLSTLNSRIAALERLVIPFQSHPVQRKNRADQIVTLVATRFGLDPETLFRRVRTEAVCWPRFLAQWLLYHHNEMTQEEIGALFHRDHGSICNALKTVESRTSTSAHYKHQRDSLVAELSTLVAHEVTSASPSPSTF
jgi:chromosomal replication initiation ATPase DnaA